MKKTIAITLIFFALLILLFTSCQHEPVLKALTLNLTAQSQPYYNAKYQNISSGGGNNTPSNNPMSEPGATLGRVLFYDPRLSVNNAVACASCHKQQYAFADNTPFSTGFQGQMTSRNTPAIINAANKSVFFWDGRVSSLETQTLMPVRNHIEMGMENTTAIVPKLSSISYYPGLFQNAFGSREISSDKIAMALSQFVRSIASNNRSSLFNSNLSADAQAGEQLFDGKYRCSSCHAGANFGGASIATPYYPISHTPTATANSSNIGLDVTYTDQGLEKLTGNVNQNGYFIIPSLLNVALTAPYMHDGRFKTLDEVIEHYNNGIQPHPDLDPILLQSNFTQGFVSATSGTPVKMNITATEKKQLIAFLTAMTDYSITMDARFSSPFK